MDPETHLADCGRLMHALALEVAVHASVHRNLQHLTIGAAGQLRALQRAQVERRDAGEEEAGQDAQQQH